MGDRTQPTAAIIFARAPVIAAARKALSLRDRRMLLTVAAWYEGHIVQPRFLPTKSISRDGSDLPSYATLVRLP